MGYRIRKVSVDAELFEHLLDEAQNNSIVLQVETKKDFADYIQRFGLKLYSFLFIGPKWVILLSKYNAWKKAVYAYLALDDKDKCMLTGADFYSYIRHCKDAREYIPDIRYGEMDSQLTEFTNKYIPCVDGKYLNTQSGILEYEPQYLHKELEVYAFDINSAYAATIYNKMPYTKIAAGYYRVLKENEVGFIVGRTLTLVTEGYADVCFTLVDTPKSIKDFLYRWYQKKEHPKDETEKQDAKACLTYSVGYMQYTNIWLRAYIVESCNDLIKELRKDADWVLVNTDCIYSIKDISAKLNIGHDIGMFKQEHGKIFLLGVDYYFERDDGKQKTVKRGTVSKPKYMVLRENYKWVVKEIIYA